GPSIRKITPHDAAPQGIPGSPWWHSRSLQPAGSYHLDNNGLHVFRDGTRLPRRSSPGLAVFRVPLCPSDSKNSFAVPEWHQNRDRSVTPPIAPAGSQALSIHRTLPRTLVPRPVAPSRTRAVKHIPAGNPARSRNGI